MAKAIADEPQIRTVRPAALDAAYKAIAAKIGASEEEAAIIARCYLQADLMGHDSQGIAMFPFIMKQAQAGGIVFGTKMTTIAEGPSFAVLDGASGPGTITTFRAMERAIRIADEAGVGSVWVRNGNDTAMVSNYSTLALEHDFVGIAMNNTGPRVSAWGGRDPLLGTNPFSFAIPAGRERPIIFDAGTSPVSGGAVVHAAREGKRFPGKYLVDDEGRFTDDPSTLVVNPYERHLTMRGSIVPLGVKGYGWLIWIEMMAGLLSGGTVSADVPHEVSADRRRTSGMYVQAINVARLVPIDTFKARVDEFIRTLKASNLAEGFDEIVLPGERAQREAERRREQGIPVPVHYWERLSDLGSELGIKV